MDCCKCMGYHEDNLSWLVNEIKKAIEEWKTLNNRFELLKEDFEELKQYVNNYFNNLDLSKEVKAILTDEYLSTFFSEYLKKITGKMLNVLSLGVKNDGSEDISKIVNQYSTTYALYFPAGEYKVENTLNIHNAIVGDTNGIYPTETCISTVFIDKVQSGETLFDLSDADRTINIRNIKIMCNECDKALYIHFSKIVLVTLDHVSVFHINHYGLYAENTVRISRALNIDNCTFWGLAGKVTDGIYIANDNCNDSYILNTKIIMCVRGIYTRSTLFLDNLHIWCGSSPYTTDLTWFKKTRGIEFSAYIQAGNLYIDTAFLCFVTTHGHADINNLFIWQDDSVPDADGSVFYFEGRKGRPVFNVNNYTCFVADKITHPNPASFSFLSYDNATFIYKHPQNIAIDQFPLATKEYFARFDTGVYTNSAIIVSQYGGVCTFYIGDDNNNLVQIVADHNIIKKVKVRGDISCYYKKDGSLFRIYTDFANVHVTPIQNADRNCWLADITKMLKEDRSQFDFITQANTDGLTEITV